MDYSKYPKLLAFCSAQEKFEGGGPGQNNPANIRCSPFNKSNWNHLAIGSNKGFCNFPDLATGQKAHQEMIYNICIGASKTYCAEAQRQFNLKTSADLTIGQMLAIYAPSSDGNSPIHYATIVCSWAGLKTTDLMSSLLDNNPPIKDTVKDEIKDIPTVPVLDNRTWWQKLLDMLITTFIH